MRDRAQRVWEATLTATGTPGHAYLAARGCWPASEALPPSVRWLPAGRAGDCDLRPRLPAGADGCLVYRFAAPGEAETCAAQIEAVDAYGTRVLFYMTDQHGKPKWPKRPAVNGSGFGSGRRTFLVTGNVDTGVWLTEGPLDALGGAHLERMHWWLEPLGGAAVVGAQSTSGFRAAACPGRAPVRIMADADGPGSTAALKLALELRSFGRPVRIVVPRLPECRGMDWTDVAADLAAEREAMCNEDAVE